MHLLMLLACAPKPSDTQDPVDSRPADPVRLVAVGDIHGDIEAARDALRLAGVIDEQDRWSGGETVLVQVGDQLDRGDHERDILDWFEQLRQEADEAGGSFQPLLGNHETMNVELDLRYVTDGGYRDFADIPHDPDDPELAAWAPEERGRVAAFRPGGPYALLLAEHKLATVVEDTLLVHGGWLPEHAEFGMQRLNEATQAWMRGEGREPDILAGNNSPVWSRHYSDETGAEECALLEETLDLMGVSRVVVAHTVQDAGINAVCEEQAWRVDVGLAAYYGGDNQALEIIDGQVRVLGL